MIFAPWEIQLDHQTASEQSGFCTQVTPVSVILTKMTLGLYAGWPSRCSAVDGCRPEDCLELPHTGRGMNPILVWQEFEDQDVCIVASMSLYDRSFWHIHSWAGWLERGGAHMSWSDLLKWLVILISYVVLFLRHFEDVTFAIWQREPTLHNFPRQIVMFSLYFRSFAHFCSL